MNGDWNWLNYLQCVVIPFIMNLFYILLAIDAIDFNQNPTSPINSIPIVALFFMYIAGAAEYTIYILFPGGPDDLFIYEAYDWIIWPMCICYPAFFLLMIPNIIIKLFKIFGTPVGIWESGLSDTGLSLDNLRTENNSNCIIFSFRCIYIGLPFIIFTTIYLIIMIFLSPLWYLIFSPAGLGMYGICAFATLINPENMITVTDRATKMLPWNLFINCYFRALSGIIFAACHIWMCFPSWSNIILFIACIIEFLITCYSAIKLMFCSDTSVCPSQYTI